jgi:hypothetical protein
VKRISFDGATGRAVHIGGDAGSFQIVRKIAASNGHQWPEGSPARAAR